MAEIDYLMKEVDYLTEQVMKHEDALYRQVLRIEALEEALSKLAPIIYKLEGW